MKKRLIKLLALFLVLSLPKIGVTGSYFIDTQSLMGNTVSTSVLDLTLRSGQNNFVPAGKAGNMKPGDSVARDIYVGKTNQSVNLKHNVSYEYVSGDSDFCQQLQLRVWYDHYHCDPAGGYVACRDMRLKYSGSLAALTEVRDSDFVIVHPDDFFDTDFSDGTEQWFYYSLSLPADTDSSFQNKTCQFNLKFKSWQENSDGSWGFCDEETLVNNLQTGDWTAPESAKVVINEVYYHGSAEKEWVELYNALSVDVNLDSWKIFDNNSNDILPGINLASGQFAVIFYDHDGNGLPAIDFSIDTGAVLIALNSPIGDGLADVGDKIVLKDNTNQEIDAMSYGNDISVFTLAGVGIGHSLARKSKGVDTDTVDDWEDLTNPNPGINPHVLLDFYFQPDRAAVGFNISGIGQYKELSYEIFYQVGEKQEGITGAIEINSENEISRENFTLGTCSSGGVCVYHQGIDVVHLEVTLSDLDSEVVLKKEINYE